MDKNTTNGKPSASSPVNSGIKSWAKDDRPREKLSLKGVRALSNAELLAILLRTGNKQHSAVGIAQQLLGSVNHDLQTLSRLSIKDLMKIKGLGEVKAVTIVAALELGRRRQSSLVPEKDKIRGAKDAAAFFQPLYADHRQEVFSVLFLNRSQRINHFEEISSGGITGTLVDPKVIMKKALEYEAVNLVLCHNHPSGNLHPSSEDKALTKKICNAALLLDMSVLDHLIVSSQGYFSFADEGLL